MNYSENSPFEAGAPFVGFDAGNIPLDLEDFDFSSLGIDLDELDLENLDQLGGFGSWLKKAVKNVGKTVGKGLKVALPVAKLAGTALAFVVPPAGIGILAAAEGADRLLAAAGAGGKLAKTASKAYQATKVLASKGDADARRALDALKVQAAQRKLTAVPKGKPSPRLSGAQLARDRAKLQKPVPLKPKPKTVITTTGIAKRAAAAKPAAAAAAGEKGYFVNLQGRIKHGKFRST